MTVSFKPPEDHDSDEDTIGEESYTESFETLVDIFLLHIQYCCSLSSCTFIH